MVEASVILPTYNRASVLPRAIESVLEQTFADFELFVIDDASTDATQQVVDQYDDPRLNYLVHSENRGASAARNTGMDAANGEYLFFLDSDDEWCRTKMERQIECLKNRSDEWVAVYCDFVDKNSSATDKLKRFVRRLITNSERTVREGDDQVIKDLLMLRFQLGGSSTLMVRRSAATAVEGFDERFPRHQDWEFLIRILERGKLAFVDKPLVYKYETGSPDAAVYAEAKEILIDKFDGHISELDAEGHDVVSKHRFALAKHYFREGNFREGISYLDLAERSAYDYLSLILSFFQGTFYKI